MILEIAIVIFIVLETLNVVIMYLAPDFKYGNSMRAFKDYSGSKTGKSLRLFDRYMVNWVANCKTIFIALLLVILFLGTEQIKIFGVLATILSIGIYFFTLHPIIVKMDRSGRIVPKGYSRILGMMILGFMVMFSAAMVLHFALK